MYGFKALVSFDESSVAVLPYLLFKFCSRAILLSVFITWLHKNNSEGGSPARRCIFDTSRNAGKLRDNKKIGFETRTCSIWRSIKMLIIELSAFHRSGTIKNMIIIIYMDVKDIEDAKYVEQNFYMELWKIINQQNTKTEKVYKSHYINR